MERLRFILLLIFFAAVAFSGLGQMPRVVPAEPVCSDLECLRSGKDIRSLDLRKNYRDGAKPDTALLRHIVWLDLSGNRLNRVPEWVCECTSLEYLDLSRNRLNILPDCLSKLNRIKYLSANRNPLGSLPAAMASCTQLEYLDLWQTWIDYLPIELRALDEGMKVVDLRDIRMTMEQQMEIHKVFPDAEVRMSAWCNCALRHKRSE